MKKTTIQGKYQGLVEFNDKHQGISVFTTGKNLRVARVYVAKSGKYEGKVAIQLHRHGPVERKIHGTNDWIPLPSDLILPLIKILQEWYVELNKEEVPEAAAFTEVSEDKELTDAIKKIGL